MLITRVNDPLILDVITEWWYQEWMDDFNESGFNSLDKVKWGVRENVANGKFIVIIMRDGASIVSCCALVVDDTDKRTCWLTNVYTRLEYRNYGYGSELVGYVIQEVTTCMNYNKILLFAPIRLMNWFNNMGFDIDVYEDKSEVIMSYNNNILFPRIIPQIQVETQLE